VSHYIFNIVKPNGDKEMNAEYENIFSNLWNGKSPLWVAYWIWGVLVGNILAFLLIATLGVFGFLIFMPYAIWSTVSIWRCAFNTNWIGWGYIARTLVVIVFIVGFINGF
jgi:hypothetical protein